MIDVARDNIVLMLEAGYMYLAMRKFKQAKEIFEGLTLLAKKHDIPQVGLANVYFSEGKFRDSIRILKNVVKEVPDSSFAWAHLGESLLFYGKREEAQESLEKAIECDDEGSSGAFAQSLLDLIAQGYDPVKLRKEFDEKNKELKAEQKKKK